MVTVEAEPSPSDVVTVCCASDFSVPLATAVARSCCTMRITSAGCLRYAAPSAFIQSGCLLSVLTTLGTAAIAFTGSSQLVASIWACVIAPDALMSAACATWSGYMHAVSVFASSESG